MRAVIYARVSTADQTTENQTLELQKVAKRNGWTVEAVFEEQIRSQDQSPCPAQALTGRCT